MNTGRNVGVPQALENLSLRGKADGAQGLADVFIETPLVQVHGLKYTFPSYWSGTPWYRDTGDCFED